MNIYDFKTVVCFTEKSTVEKTRLLLVENAFWNVGAFPVLGT